MSALKICLYIFVSSFRFVKIWPVRGSPKAFLFRCSTFCLLLKSSQAFLIIPDTGQGIPTLSYLKFPFLEMIETIILSSRSRVS